MSELSIVLWATEIEPLVQFLVNPGGATLLDRHPGFASLLFGETRLEVHADEAYQGHPWFDALRREGAARGIGSELRIACDDVDAAWETAIRQGAVGIVGPADLGETYECVVMGPDGYLFSFWEAREAPSGD